MKKILFIVIAAFLAGVGGCFILPPELVTSIREDNYNNEKSPINNKLDLSNQNLAKIPEYVFRMTNLRELNASGNRLTGAVQAEIRNLRNLEILDLSDNLMTGVPAEIGQLANLEILNLSGNNLTGLPYELGNLQKLKILNLSGNNYSELDLGIIEQNLPDTVNIIR